MARREIAIVGGGPKAAAIAAKAFCLRETRTADIAVTVFEKAQAGANWTGGHGYTNGDQRLCTPAERDMGFPYDPGTFGQPVTDMMLGRFSWNAHLLRQAPEALAEWVNQGGPPPLHRQFAAYVAEVLAQALPPQGLVHGEVTALERAQGWWWVQSASGGARAWRGGFDAVVITGPGPANDIFPGLSSPRLFNGDSFWRSLPAVRTLLAAAPGDDGEVVIAGGGGTAAAAAAWLAQQDLQGRSIMMVANQAALYTRTNTYFENALFNDANAWAALSPDAQRDFTNRLTRGVVWEAVASTLAQCEALELIPGRAVRAALTPPPPPASLPASAPAPPPALTVQIAPSNPKMPAFALEADVLIDATGFDRWWFLGLLPAAIEQTLAARKDQLERRLRPDLSLRAKAAPRLHVPGISQNVGPGFTSLMVLGDMADRILEPYA